ncbi:transcription accessory [Micractinium conductrix]|uniref:Transcription accessory n=1 Tax=Micractinium conductrix TaxID=554055 RepID=A0A2P6VK47_9CHLO|nr:transcription accessory [Micractinium conductrix]|eukprot:PSC74448.1 transcription accessory [Micractinium conductrix]
MEDEVIDLQSPDMSPGVIDLSGSDKVKHISGGVYSQTHSDANAVHAVEAQPGWQARVATTNFGACGAAALLAAPPRSLGRHVSEASLGFARIRGGGGPVPLAAAQAADPEAAAWLRSWLERNGLRAAD